MYSRCPHCDSRQEHTVEHWRQRGWLVCVACGERFDGLQVLSDDTLDVSVLDIRHRDWAVERPQARAVWALASWAMLCLLAVQVIYFEGLRLSMQPQLRAGLQSLCAVLDCQLPVYSNLDEWAVTHGDLQIKADKALFTAALSNQAAFPQAAPDLKLTLLNFSGQAMAERVFAPWQYVRGAELLSAEQTAEIRLDMVLPTAQVGGYTFALL